MATHLEKWVEEQAQLAKPDKIYWCNGSEEEAKRIIEIGLKEEKIGNNNIFSELNQTVFPKSYLHRSNPTDVARTEHLTFVCHNNKEDAGPNNNWMDPAQAKEKMKKLSDGCMRGRTMYVMPFTMGHPDSPYSKACVQITDVSYVAISMGIMTRMGTKAKEKIGNSDKFWRGFHSIGDLSPDRRFIMHFPDEHFVWSIGSGYGGNALLGKKCLSLRIASYLGLKEDWLAEHMIIIGIEDPSGKITYVLAALPSACGKTNLAMMQPTLPGYKIWTLGDDIAWLNIGSDGKLWAINPENGFFGVAPGTSMKTNPNMMKTLKAGITYPTLFTNTALDTNNNAPWWEGIDGNMPKNLVDWQGEKWDPEKGTKAAHPNSRFTVAAKNCPTLSKEFENPEGVPISAIIFGGRRSKLIPLIYESKSWQNGVFWGACMGSETTAAAAHQIGVLRRDPMAMLPFCGYNMADYFSHWLEMGKKISNAPKIFFVNWFRTDENNKFMWPGFGENIRVLKWIIERTQGKIEAKETPIGLVPNEPDFETQGLEVEKETLKKLFDVNMDEWKDEVSNIEKFLSGYGNKMPQGILDEFKKLLAK